MCQMVFIFQNAFPVCMHDLKAFSKEMEWIIFKCQGVNRLVTTPANRAGRRYKYGFDNRVKRRVAGLNDDIKFTLDKKWQ